MTTIAQCLTFPNGTPIDGLLVKIDKVWAPPKQINGKFGPTSVQNVSLADISGNKIRASVWGHADLTPNVGQDVALQSNNGKGIKVMHKPYTDKNGTTQPGIELEISKDIVFQSPAIGGKAPAPAAHNAPQAPVASNPSQSGGIRGEKVGMALNNACNSLSSEGIQITKKSLWERASLIILVGNELEKGNVYGEKTVVVEAPKQAPVVPVSPEPVDADPSDGEDVPF
jgi:hypothetical protein